MDTLRYDRPAKKWFDALPLGNGNIGAMVTGGIHKDTIYVNDDTFWSGYPREDKTSSREAIDKARELILADKVVEGNKYLEDNIYGDWSESYLPIGNIDIIYSVASLGAKDYERTLDLKTGIHTSSFVLNNAKHTRESMVSYPDKCGMYRASSGAKFNMKIRLSSPWSKTIRVDNGITLVGVAPDKVFPNYVYTEKRPFRFDEHKGMAYALRAEVMTDGDVYYGKNYIKVVGATHADIYYKTATGYKGYNVMPDNNIDNIFSKVKKELSDLQYDFDVMKERHVEDFSALYDKVHLSLGESDELTSSLVQRAKSGDVDVALMELFYNFGRYLMISGSREGTIAMGLQGIWNKDKRPAWSANYTVNINTEMNYWGLRGMPLDECFEPYITLLEKVHDNGKKTARDCFKTDGFVTNHNVDIWGKTTPLHGMASWAFFPMAGVWLTNELWDMYEYNQDIDYLKRVEPIITDAMLFASSWLVEKDGKLVTCPSTSPEINFYKDGKCCSVDMASTFDMSNVEYIMRNYLKMADILGITEHVDMVKDKLSRLIPYAKDKEGALQEWQQDREIRETGHRHFSPLYSIFPSFNKEYYKDREFFDMARKLMDRRINAGSGQTGWSAAWAISLYARFHDGKMAGKMLERQMSQSIANNLFDLHPPYIFQIDGNLGTVQAVHEMLVTVEDGVIELLPALPDKWKDGSIRGLRARGGYIIDMQWKDKKVVSLRIGGKGIRLKNANLSENLAIQDEISLI